MSRTKEYFEDRQHKEDLSNDINTKLKGIGSLHYANRYVENSRFAHTLKDIDTIDQLEVLGTLAESINVDVLKSQTLKNLDILNSSLNRLYAVFYNGVNTEKLNSVKNIDGQEVDLVAIFEHGQVYEANNELRSAGVLLTNNFDKAFFSNLLQEIESQLKNIITISISSLSNIPNFRKEISELKSQMDIFRKRIHAESDSFRGILEQDREIFKGQMDEEVEKAKRASEAANRSALEAGVAKHYDIFEKEAQHHSIQSWIWLGVLSLIILTAIGFVIYLMEYATKPNYSLLNTNAELNKSLQEVNSEAFRYELAQYVLNKIIIISALFYGLSICTRNYKAHRHNAIVNRHRHNALATFQSFTNAATDEHTKNAILLEATHSIFSSQHTGYMGADVETESPNKIIEIFRSTNSK